MKIKNIVTGLLIAIILVSCAPAAKIVPTETLIPTSTFTPKPTVTLVPPSNTPEPTPTIAPTEYATQFTQEEIESMAHEVISKLIPLVERLPSPYNPTSSTDPTKIGNIFEVNLKTEEGRELVRLTQLALDLIASGNADLIAGTNFSYALLMPSYTPKNEGLPLIGGQRITVDTIKSMEESGVSLWFPGTVMPPGKDKVLAEDTIPGMERRMEAYDKYGKKQDFFFSSFSRGSGIAIGLTDSKWMELGRITLPEESSSTKIYFKSGVEEFDLPTLESGLLGFHRIIISTEPDMQRLWNDLSQRIGPFAVNFVLGVNHINSESFK